MTHGADQPPRNDSQLEAERGERERTRPGAAFGYPAFRFFQAARVLATLGFQMQGVAVAWQVYALTHQPLHLGYVGLAQFLPAFGFALLTGHAADRFERRRVLVVCHCVLAACSAVLAMLSFASADLKSTTQAAHTGVTHSANVWAIYGVLVLIGSARAFAGPASQALLPNLVETRHFANAIAWSSTFWHVATVAGPALGGVAYAAAGRATEVYVIAAVLELGAVACFAAVRVGMTPRETRPTSLDELLAGLRYVRRHPLILGAISLDMFGVLFGGAVALLPVYARDILHVGPTGLGMLRSAPAVGATATAVFLAYKPLVRHAGPWLYVCVTLFGAATIAFGISSNFSLSLGLLAIVGAVDMVSVFVRHTVVQLSTPDAMRGRVSAVNIVFIGASNELGEFESGLTAAWLGTVPAVVAGGIGTLLVVALWAFIFPELRRVDRLIPTS